MTNIHEWINTGLIFLVLVLVLVGGNQPSTFSGQTDDFFDAGDGFRVDGTELIDTDGNVTADNGITVGTSGTSIERANYGTCDIFDVSTTITASSTNQVTCNGDGTTASGSTLTGITAGDICFLQAPTTTPTTLSGLNLNGANASTTSGVIHGFITNQTGTTFTWTAAASSSWQYYCVDLT